MLALGVFLAVFVFYSFIQPHLEISKSVGNSIFGGASSGFFSGVIGTGGAIRAAFLSAVRVKKTAYVATSAALSLTADLTRIPIYIKSGFLPTVHYMTIPLLFIIAIVSAFIGKKIIHMIPQERFRKLVLTAILLVSFKFIYEGILPFF